MGFDHTKLEERCYQCGKILKGYEEEGLCIYCTDAEDKFKNEGKLK